MKKIILSVITLLFALNAGAQVYLVKAFKPTEQRKYSAHYKGVRGADETSGISNFQYTNGFSFYNGVTNDQAKDYGYAVFSLKGEYEKISFVLGPGRDDKFSAGDDYSNIAIVRADGRRILDEVVRVWDAPREFTLDISGVDQLRFEHWSGLQRIDFEEVRLWKKGQTPTPAPNPLASVITKDKVNLIDELEPHIICHRGWSNPVTTKHDWSGVGETASIKMNRMVYTSGLEMSCSQEFGKGISQGFAYFWLQRQFDKVSFLIGPRDNMSSNAKGWFTVKADGKIIYEKLITQQDLVEQVTLDVKGVNVVSMHSGELEQSDFLGGLTYGVVDIYAYKKGYAGVPQSGMANTAKARLSKLPNAVPLCSNLEPYSVRGTSSFDKIYFSGESSHYHFSMGGEQFDEGFILTTGSTFMDGNKDSYVAFDLANEFDYVSFTVGSLSKRRVLGEDRLLVYADDNLILDTQVHVLWPNQKFTLPIGKCRVLKFAKPGTGESKQMFIGVGDVMVFRGEPRDTAPYFYHRKPESPQEVDLIDYCQAPYFHYVGRYLSTLTNFDINDCFKPGGSLKEYFPMKDGSKIYKGIMLETNVPPALAFEDIDLNTAVFLFVVGAGSAISASEVAAVTGVSAGAGIAGAMAAGYSALNLVGDKNHQSSVAAFNPFGEYETLTFSVANKSEFVDTDIFGAKLNPDNPVKLHVFADMRMVGSFWLTNRMQPTTFTVPINKCTQLVFWLECGDTRSGQYVLYDMTLSKTPMSPDEWPVLDAVTGAPVEAPAPSNDRNARDGRVDWHHPSSRSRVDAIDTFFADLDQVWAKTNTVLDDGRVDYDIQETYVQTRAGKVYKAVSLVRNGQRYGFSEIIARNKKIMDNATSVQISITGAYVGVPGANLGVLNLQGDDLYVYPEFVKLGSKVLAQCKKDMKDLNKAKEKENEDLQKLMKKAITVDGIASTDKVLLMPLGKGEKAPATGTMQMLEYYNMN